MIGFGAIEITGEEMAEAGGDLFKIIRKKLAPISDDYRHAREIVESYTFNMLQSADIIGCQPYQIAFELTNGGLELLIKDCYVSDIPEDEARKIAQLLVDKILSSVGKIYEQCRREVSTPTEDHGPS
jgi:hypothetical protein